MSPELIRARNREAERSASFENNETGTLALGVCVVADHANVMIGVCAMASLEFMTVTRFRFSFSRQRGGGRSLPVRSFVRSRADCARWRTCDDESARAPRSLPSLSLGRWRDLCGSLAPLSLSQPWAFRLWPENLGPELVLGGGERRSQGRGVDT